MSLDPGGDALATAEAWADHMGKRTVAAEERIRRLETLVRWLAIPYGDNLPIFATELPDGRPLDDGKDVAETYLEVVGDRRPLVTGAWFQCETCGTWQVRNDTLEEPLHSL